MPAPNIKYLEKTIDADGVIEVDLATDGLDVGGVTHPAIILVQPNGTDPTIHLKGIRMLAAPNDPLGFGTTAEAWWCKFRAEDGETITVDHLSGDVASNERIFVPVIEAAGVLTAKHTLCVWRDGIARLNLDTAA